jgi:uncharacterized protein YbjQ (UPF0145 family)
MFPDSGLTADDRRPDHPRMPCPVCERPVASGAPRCPHCGADFVELAASHRPATKAPAGPMPEAAFPGKHDPADDIILTTTPTVPGYRVVRVVDLVTAECVVSLGDPARRAMADNVRVALAGLRRAAHAAGADAVVGVDFDYIESANSLGRALVIVVNGTAVGLDAE